MLSFGLKGREKETESYAIALLVGAVTADGNVATSFYISSEYGALFDTDELSDEHFYVLGKQLLDSVKGRAYRSLPFSPKTNIALVDKVLSNLVLDDYHEPADELADFYIKGSILENDEDIPCDSLVYIALMHDPEANEFDTTVGGVGDSPITDLISAKEVYKAGYNAYFNYLMGATPMDEIEVHEHLQRVDCDFSGEPEKLY